MFINGMHFRRLCGGKTFANYYCEGYLNTNFCRSNYVNGAASHAKGVYHVKPNLNLEKYISTISRLRFPEQNNSANNDTLTKAQAQELALKLTVDERKILLFALQEFESQRIKNEFEGQLAGHRWRSKFGRPSKVLSLGDVDPTGTYCAVPEDWLKKKYAATVPPPCTRDLVYLAIANSIPFIGFGFLDNFIMIVAGDYIDKLMGAYICISTMAAAALGNTFSDVIGIGSAQYVEKGAEMIGFKPPELSPIQLDMRWSRRMSNLGRVVGITIGCLLGMIPLLFMDEKTNAAQEP